MNTDKKYAPLRPHLCYCGGDGGEEWREILRECALDLSHNGADDRLDYRKGGCPISTTDEVGLRGESVYTLKTVYTDITVDCERDPAYDYGLHFRGAYGSDEEFYRDRETAIEVWMVRGQDGRIYVYGEVTDPDIVVNDEIMSFKPHYCDGLHPYVDDDNYGQFSKKLGLITADDSGKHLHRAPAGCKVRMTESGFCFEYAFDNGGKPYFEGDIFGFNFFYNDTNEYVDFNNYKRTLLKLPSRLNPMGSPFKDISAEFDDAIRVSAESATGAFELSEADLPEKKGMLIEDILSGAISVGIVWDELSPAHTVISANNILKRLRAYGARAKVGTTEGCDSVISLGGRGVAIDEYSLTFNKGEIRACGWLEGAVNCAEGLLMSALEYVFVGGSSEDLLMSYGGRIEGVPTVPVLDELDAVTDVGEGAYLMLRLGADESDFAKYISKLEKNGYTLAAENEMVSLICRTYVGHGAVVNVTYGRADGDRSLRVVVDPAEKTAIPPTAESFEKVVSPAIAQLATKKMLWMCYVVRLENGEYLVIDSGGNRAGDFLYQSLTELSGGEEVTVACWLITHFHQDHVGGLVSLAQNDEYLKKIKVKNIITNFPQKQVLNTATGSGDRRNMALWDETLRRIGACHYRARTGQKYFFGGAELEMLFTYEDLMPFNVYAVRTNPTSHIVSLKIGGQRIMILGDACREATEICVTRYGEALRSDFVQLSHHGWGDGGTSEEFYRLVGAPYVLYPSATYSPKPAEEMACRQADKIFLNPDENVVIDLPYTPKERN